MTRISTLSLSGGGTTFCRVEVGNVFTHIGGQSFFFRLEYMIFRLIFPLIMVSMFRFGYFSLTISVWICVSEIVDPGFTTTISPHDPSLFSGNRWISALGHGKRTASHMQVIKHRALSFNSIQFLQPLGSEWDMLAIPPLAKEKIHELPRLHSQAILLQSYCHEEWATSK